MQDGPALFSEDYQKARKRFCETASAKGWKLESHQRSGGREDELYTDLARVGSPQPEKLWVISSGLHGVEGFLGSAIQLSLLEKLNPERFENSNNAVLLVHALNPFGFARIRRFDERNIDVNRNFLLPGKEYCGSHRYYSKFDSLLNPKKWPKWELPPHLQALLKIVPYGFKNLQQAIAQGQYDFPLGLFFGGNEPSSTMHFVEEKLLPEFPAAKKILHLDIHSGLGRRGQQKLLFDYKLDAVEEKNIQNIAGKRLKLDNVGTHYEAFGSFYSWLRHHVPQAATFCWEFGTYGPINVLIALRAENAACHWGDRGSEAFTKSKEKLKEAFCPQGEKWRTKVLREATETLDSVLSQWLM